MSMKLKTASGSITLAPEDGSGDISVTIPRAGVLSAGANSVTDTELNSAKLNGIETGATADQSKADIEALGIAASSITGALPAIDGSALTGIDGLPSQSGQTGKYLTTNGSAASWGTVASGGVNITSNATAPTSPAVGDQWYDTANGVLYVRVTDGTDAAWLDISSANGTAAAGGGGGGGVVELISSTIVTSDVSSVAFTSLDLTGYSQLQIVVRGMASDSESMYDGVLQINGEDGYTSPAEYRYYGGNQQWNGINFTGGSVKVGGHVNATIALIPGNSTRFTTAFIEGVANRSSSISHMTGTWSSSRAWSMYTKKEAVTSLTFQWWAQSTDIIQGEFYLYGTKTS